MTRQDLRRQGEAMLRMLRPGLEPRQQVLGAIVSFTALRPTEQAAKFGVLTLNIGLTKSEVLEAIIQTAPLTGFPPALNALGAASPALSL
jgi:4-carboxymuconolactone decarboxylase